MLWQLIAYAAGTGGSMLIIGSASGVAFMGIEQARFQGVGWDECTCWQAVELCPSVTPGCLLFQYFLSWKRSFFSPAMSSSMSELATPHDLHGTYEARL
jgi:hypothetical protein